MLNIGNKTFMNLQEAVGWLLENNALPFQSTANYVANTEIAMSTLVNPSPAKVRVGSLIFFADSKVSTVIGLTSNSFIVSDQYNDLVDDVVYVSNVAINASGHLICTLSNGDTIDAGQIKQVTSFSIDASQHLIANYNDGTSTDLGAIFTGNVYINGNFTANSIIEVNSGITGAFSNTSEKEYVYCSACKNGNKLTLVVAMKYTPSADKPAGTDIYAGFFSIPSAIANKIYPIGTPDLNNVVDIRKGIAATTVIVNVDMTFRCLKTSATGLEIYVRNLAQLNINTVYYIRYELTILLSDNMVS